jgi:hypothetical protein
MNPKQNRPIENLLEGLSQHARFLTKEERKAELRERGVDVDRFLDMAHSIIAHHQKEERLAWRKIATEKAERFSGSESRFASWVGRGKEEIMVAFQKAISKLSPQQALAFRNKKELSVEDMARILDDYERLRTVEGDEKKSQQKQ